MPWFGALANHPTVPLVHLSELDKRADGDFPALPVVRSNASRSTGIFLQLFLNIGVFVTLATDNVGANRFQVGLLDFCPTSRFAHVSLRSRRSFRFSWLLRSSWLSSVSSEHSKRLAALPVP